MCWNYIPLFLKKQFWKPSSALTDLEEFCFIFQVPLVALLFLPVYLTKQWHSTHISTVGSFPGEADSAASSLWNLAPPLPFLSGHVCLCASTLSPTVLSSYACDSRKAPEPKENSILCCKQFIWSVNVAGPHWLLLLLYLCITSPSFCLQGSCKLLSLLSSGARVKKQAKGKAVLMCTISKWLGISFGAQVLHHRNVARLSALRSFQSWSVLPWALCMWVKLLSSHQ